MDKKTKAARDFRLSQFFWVITQQVVVISVPKRREDHHYSLRHTPEKRSSHLLKTKVLCRSGHNSRVTACQ